MLFSAESEEKEDRAELFSAGNSVTLKENEGGLDFTVAETVGGIAVAAIVAVICCTAYITWKKTNEQSTQTSDVDRIGKIEVCDLADFRDVQTSEPL